MNDEIVPELLQPVMSSNAAQTKPSILSCTDPAENVSANPAKRRKLHDNNCQVAGDVARKTKTRRQSTRIASVKTSHKQKLTFSSASSDSEGKSNEPTCSASTSTNNYAKNRKVILPQTRKPIARRKSIAVCSNDRTSQPLRRSRRQSVMIQTDSSNVAEQSIVTEYSTQSTDDHQNIDLAEDSQTIRRKLVSQTLSKVSPKEPGPEKLKSNHQRDSKASAAARNGRCSESEVHVIRSLARSHDDEGKRTFSVDSSISSSYENGKRRLDKRKWIKQTIEEAYDSQENRQTMAMTSLHFEYALFLFNDVIISFLLSTL